MRKLNHNLTLKRMFVRNLMIHLSSMAIYVTLSSACLFFHFPGVSLIESEYLLSIWNATLFVRSQVFDFAGKNIAVALPVASR